MAQRRIAAGDVQAALGFLPVDYRAQAPIVISAGTISLSGGLGAGTGTVTRITTGTGLTGGPITEAGTISFAPLTAGCLLGNPDIGAVPPRAISIGAGLALTQAGTLSVTLSPGSATLAGSTDVSITAPAGGDRLRYSGSANKWTNGREPYVVAGFVPGTLTSSQIVLAHTFGAAVRFAANFAATNSGAVSAVTALVNATVASTLTVNRCPAASDPTQGANWTQIGTITFPASGHAAALATTSGATVAFAQGDMLKVIGDASPDGTLANIMVTLAGDR